jgi:lysophospholipase L1-like esterase
MPTTPGAPAFRWAVEEMGAKPRYAIWALGMNNGDKLGNEVPAAAWLTATEEFIEICSDNGIIPILATIPSTPTVYNELKNAWVRESGYRYIDFAEAVAYYDEALIGTDTEKADENGGFVKNTTGFAWYDDMLSIDQVHPAASGAIALYEKVLRDFPEIKNSKPE